MYRTCVPDNHEGVAASFPGQSYRFHSYVKHITNTANLHIYTRGCGISEYSDVFPTSFPISNPLSFSRRAKRLSRPFTSSPSRRGGPFSGGSSPSPAPRAVRRPPRLGQALLGPSRGLAGGGGLFSYFASGQQQVRKIIRSTPEYNTVRK